MNFYNNEWLLKIKFYVLHSEEHRNNFVRIQIIPESFSINCSFLSVDNGAPLSCNATITFGEACQNQRSINGTRDIDNDFLVVIGLKDLVKETVASGKYCEFRVYATANSRTVTIDGTLGILSKPAPIL